MLRPSSPIAIRAAAVASLAALTALGCAFGEVNLKDPFNRGYTLREAQHQYTEYVRWSEFQKASSFVNQEVRDAFLRDAPSFRKLRFTDYEVGSVEIDEESGGSVVEVTYYAYTTTSPLEIEVKEVQHWARDGITNDWQVKPEFEGLADPVLTGSR